MHKSLRLIWKLLFINMLALLIVLAVVAVSVHSLAADYFVKLMVEYDISPDTAHAMFLHAVDRYLLIAGACSFVVAIALCFWLNIRQTTPITEITRLAKLIAAGNFQLRVVTQGCGEVNQLAEAFNEMAEQLERGERLRQDFIVDVSHELRTPLTNIQGFMEGLRDGVVKPERTVFEGLHRESVRLSGLVADLMQSVLVSTKDAMSKLQPERCNLTALIEQVIAQFDVRIAERNLTLKNELGQSIWIESDRQRIVQVISNLLENACRYATPETTIVVSAENRVSGVLVSVDNAVETVPKDPALLFERFQRGEASRSRAYGGAGLGLAIVKEIVEAHGGRVGCGFEGGRATFWFELPRA